MDGELVAGLDDLLLVDVLRGFDIGVRCVAEDFRRPFARAEELRAQIEVTRLCVRHARRVPRAALAARAGAHRVGIALEPDRVIPNDRSLGHELEALEILLVLRRRIAEHLQRREVKRHHRHLTAARADRAGIRVRALVKLLRPDRIVVHRARRVVQRTRAHADEIALHVARHHVPLRRIPLRLLEAMDALEVEDVRVGALHAGRLEHAMVVDEHVLLRAGIRKFPEEVDARGVVTVHEVDLEALRAELGEIRGDLLLLANDLRPGHPEDDADAALLRVLDEVRHIDPRMILPDVQLLAPALVEDDILDAVLRREVDEALVALRRAALFLAEIVEGVPPVPRDLAGLDPLAIARLVRRRKSPDEIALDELGRVRSDLEAAPRERARALRLHEEILALQHLLRTEARIRIEVIVPPALAERHLLRKLREFAAEEDALVSFAVLEVPARIVDEVGLRHAHRRAVRRLEDERQIGDLPLRHLELTRQVLLVHGLPAVLQRIALEVRPVVVHVALRLGTQRKARLLAVDRHLAWELRLKPVRDAIIARHEAHAEIAVVDEGLLPLEADLVLLVDFGLLAAGERLRRDLLHHRVLAQARAVDLHADRRLRDKRLTIAQHLVGEWLQLEADFVMAVRRDRRRLVLRDWIARAASHGRGREHTREVVSSLHSCRLSFGVRLVSKLYHNSATEGNAYILRSR